jgi:hypothetical protein
MTVSLMRNGIQEIARQGLRSDIHSPDRPGLTDPKLQNLNTHVYSSAHWLVPSYARHLLNRMSFTHLEGTVTEGAVGASDSILNSSMRIRRACAGRPVWRANSAGIWQLVEAHPWKVNTCIGQGRLKMKTSIFSGSRRRSAPDDDSDTILRCVDCCSPAY